MNAPEKDTIITILVEEGMPIKAALKASNRLYAYINALRPKQGAQLLPTAPQVQHVNLPLMIPAPKQKSKNERIREICEKICEQHCISFDDVQDGRKFQAASNARLEIIPALRKEFPKITTHELADWAGVSKSYVSYILKGANP